MMQTHTLHTKQKRDRESRHRIGSQTPLGPPTPVAGDGILLYYRAWNGAYNDCLCCPEMAARERLLMLEWMPGMRANDGPMMPQDGGAYGG